MSAPVVLQLQFHKEVPLEMIEAIEQAIKPFGYRLHDFSQGTYMPSAEGSFIQLEEDK